MVASGTVVFCPTTYGTGRMAMEAVSKIISRIFGPSYVISTIAHTITTNWYAIQMKRSLDRAVISPHSRQHQGDTVSDEQQTPSSNPFGRNPTEANDQRGRGGDEANTRQEYTVVLIMKHVRNGSQRKHFVCWYRFT